MTTDPRASSGAQSAAAGLRGETSGEGAATAACLAYRYAQCRDLSHCPYCSTLEQTLRAAASFHAAD
jgi:hypothetical protein